MAFTPLAALVEAGSIIVKFTSYMTVAGRILGSVLVLFFPSFVSPRIGVISEPEYVVGIHMCGSPVLIDMAFPSPMVDPPPIEMIESACVNFAYLSAFSVIDDGVCIIASANIPATLPFSKSSRTFALSNCPGVERRRGEVTPNLATSSANLETVPVPKITLAGAPLYSKASIVYIEGDSLRISCLFSCLYASYLQQ
jgi:hypothetical protein